MKILKCSSNTLRLKLSSYNQNSNIILVFHDCVSSQCDGCLNLDNPSNAGLDKIVKDLDQLYVGTYDSDMSRADFWALAAIKSLEVTAQRANGGSCTFGA